MATTPTCQPPTDETMPTAGFTLMEMLVVISAIGLLAALTVPSISRRPAFIERERLFDELRRKIARAASEAQTSGRVIRLDIDGKKGESRSRFKAAIGVTGQPVFYPDGSSNGGLISIGSRPLLKISWLDASVVHAPR